jgi:predicted MFS family arabinose efflux permease
LGNLNINRVNSQDLGPQMTQSVSSLPPHRETLLQRDFVLTVAATFFYMLNFISFYLLPLIVKSLGGNEIDIGFVSGTGWITSVVCTPFVGILVDRWGRKVFLLTGAAFLTAAGMGFFWVDRIGPLIYFLRVLQGVGLATGLTAGYALVADLTPTSRRGEAYGVFMVATLAPHALGPWLGEQALNLGGPSAFFGVTVGYGILSLVLGGFVRPPMAQPSQVPSSSLLGLLFRRDLWPVMGTSLLVGSGFSAILTFIPTYLKFRGFESVGFFFVTYTVVAVVIRTFFAKLSDQWGRRRVIVPNLFGMVAVLSFLALAEHTTLFVIAALIFGTNQGFLYPTLGALVVDRVDTASRGRALGLFSGLFHLGVFLNASIMGNVAARFGYPRLYWLSAAVALFSLFFFALSDPSKTR